MSMSNCSLGQGILGVFDDLSTRYDGNTLAMHNALLTLFGIYRSNKKNGIIMNAQELEKEFEDQIKYEKNLPNKKQGNQWENAGELIQLIMKSTVSATQDEGNQNNRILKGVIGDEVQRLNAFNNPDGQVKIKSDGSIDVVKKDDFNAAEKKACRDALQTGVNKGAKIDSQQVALVNARELAKEASQVVAKEAPQMINNKIYEQKILNGKKPDTAGISKKNILKKNRREPVAKTDDEDDVENNEDDLTDEITNKKFDQAALDFSLYQRSNLGIKYAPLVFIK